MIKANNNSTKSKLLLKLSSSFTQLRKEWIEPLIVALILVGIIRAFIFQPFKIPSGSMEDTLLIGDQFIAIKFIYGIKIPFTGKRILKFRDPKPGDIIVFKFPKDPSKDFIKRCVATGGQRVEIKRKIVYVDGVIRKFPEHVKFDDRRTIPIRDNFPGFVIPDGNFFMMGDNRDNSNDSRFWGYVPYENIIGKAFILYWSWDEKASLLKKVRWGRLFTLIQ